MVHWEMHLAVRRSGEEAEVFNSFGIEDGAARRDLTFLMRWHWIELHLGDDNEADGKQEC